MSLAVQVAQAYGSYSGFSNLGDAVSAVVKKGTRVSYRGSIYDALYAVPVISQAQLDAIRRWVEKGEYRDVRVSGNYSYVTIEATLGRDKTSLYAIRDSDFSKSVLYGFNEGSTIFMPAGAVAVRDTTINITPAAPAVIAPRIPNPTPAGGGGGGGATTPPGQPQTIWDYLGISNPFGVAGGFGMGATLATVAFVILALRD
jgi:hypothetical protein